LVGGLTVPKGQQGGAFLDLVPSGLVCIIKMESRSHHPNHQVNATAPALGTNSTMSFELTSNTSLKIVVRGTDGVTRSVSLTLA